MKFKKKLLKIIIIHENRNKNLKKKYKKIFKNNLIINKNLIIYLKNMYYTINKLIKNNNKIFKIIIILIWKGKHIKDISVLIKNILKLNKKIKINYFNNIGNFKNFKNIISKLIKK